eukprot:2098451-Rhodomonas_salina.2
MPVWGLFTIPMGKKKQRPSLSKKSVNESMLCRISFLGKKSNNPPIPAVISQYFYTDCVNGP